MRLHRFKLNRTESLNDDVVPLWVRQVAERLTGNGYKAYMVGGAVRDLIWGLTPHDWDMATDALPETVETLFPNSIPTGKRFGTITVTKEGGPIEITTLREDLGYHDGRRPTGIRYCGDIVKDLERRDFTINAMAIDMASLELVDPHQGRRDCQRGFLRAIGDPAVRFQEDGLRMFRFFRFIATYPLHAEGKTARAINPVYAQNVSWERIRDEFNKTLVGSRVRIGLIGLEKSGLLTFMLPEIEPVLHFNLGRPHRLWEHILKTVEAIAPTLELRLAALLHDIAKPETVSRTESGIHFYDHDAQGADVAGKILQRLRYPNKTIEKVQTLIRQHMFNIPPQAGSAAFRRFIARVGAETIPDLLELRRADIVASDRINRDTWDVWTSFTDEVNHHLHEAQNVASQLAINGNDIREHLQLRPGPVIGDILDYLGEMILDNPGLNQREALLDAAEKYLKEENK